MPAISATPTATNSTLSAWDSQGIASVILAPLELSLRWVRRRAAAAFRCGFRPKSFERSTWKFTPSSQTWRCETCPQSTFRAVGPIAPSPTFARCSSAMAPSPRRLRCAFSSRFAFCWVGCSVGIVSARQHAEYSYVEKAQRRPAGSLYRGPRNRRRRVSAVVSISEGGSRRNSQHHGSCVFKHVDPPHGVRLPILLGNLRKEASRGSRPSTWRSLSRFDASQSIPRSCGGCVPAWVAAYSHGRRRRPRRGLAGGEIGD